MVLPLRRDGRPVDDERTLSATWDELSRLAAEAWSWRDPESLERLEACIEQLWPEVDCDWDPDGERPARPAPRRRIRDAATHFAPGFVAVLSWLSSGFLSWFAST